MRLTPAGQAAYRVKRESSRRVRSLCGPRRRHRAHARMLAGQGAAGAAILTREGRHGWQSPTRVCRPPTTGPALGRQVAPDTEAQSPSVQHIVLQRLGPLGLAESTSAQSSLSHSDADEHTAPSAVVPALDFVRQILRTSPAAESKSYETQLSEVSQSASPQHSRAQAERTRSHTPDRHSAFVAQAAPCPPADEAIHNSS